MPRTSRRLGTPALAAALVLTGLAACGDDASDHELVARRTAERLAEQRAQQAATSTTVAAPPVTEPGPGTPDTAPPAAPATTAPAGVEPTGVIVPVMAIDNTFRPERIEVQVGDEVVWENRGRNEHDILSIEGVLADGTAWGIAAVDFGPGALYAHVFTEPGEYRYYCTIHGTADVGMIGTVIVSA